MILFLQIVVGSDQDLIKLRQRGTPHLQLEDSIRAILAFWVLSSVPAFAADTINGRVLGAGAPIAGRGARALPVNSLRLKPMATAASPLTQTAKAPPFTALRSEADMRGALGHVRLGPIF
jgi:hypothetical protein